MGQQQLLLIVLGVIIVGIAIAVGISMFKSNAVSSNRDQVINDLNNLGAKAEQFWRKPTSMAGGGQSFAGFGLTVDDTLNGNGMYAISAIGGSYPTPSTTPGNYASSISTGAVGSAPADSFLVINGWGTEVGNDQLHKVEAVIIVSPTRSTQVSTTVIN